MTINKTIRNLLLIAGLTSTAFALQPATKPDLSLMKKELQQVLDQTRKQYDFGAMSITIIDAATSKKPVTLMSGQTQKKHGRPLQLNDYYQIGSNTKSFVAALLVKLAEEKHFSLNDPITKWLPEYSDWKDVKITHLLHNNSGIFNFSLSDAFQQDLEANPKRTLTAADLVAYAYKKPRKFTAGKGWEYSNTNWILAGMVAEKAGGEKLNVLLNKHFIKKLPLSHTRYWPKMYNKEILQHMVHGYDDEGNDVTYDNMSWANAAGAIIASNEDLAKWSYALFHGQAVDSKQLKTMQKLVSVKTGKPLPSDTKEGGYGTGIGKKSIKHGFYWGHEGHTRGYHSLFAWFPAQDITIVLQANGLKDAQFPPVLEKVMEILKKHGDGTMSMAEE